MIDEIYNKAYYETGCGLPYEESEPWVNHFGIIADKIVETINPKTVLDAGCAMGYLVAALRDRGVEAYGIDISNYAISKVREDIRPYCVVGALNQPIDHSVLPEKFDLVTSVEVLEHMNEEDGKRAIANICALTDRILFSSSPDDVTEPTHINVQQREYWARIFAENGFFTDLNYRPFYLAEHAVCFKRSNNWLRQLDDYEHNTRLAMREIKSLKEKYGISKQIVTVLIDSGKGYVEKDRIYSCHTSEEDYVNIGITVPAGGKTIRIDPVQGYSCMVSEVVVQPCEPGVTISLREHNGICVGNHFLFECDEPQMIYDVEGVTPCVVQIIATVTVFPTAEIVRRIRRLLKDIENEKNRKLEAATEQCHQESIQWRQEVEETKRLLDTHIEKNRELEAAVEQSHQESTQWKQEAEETKRLLDTHIEKNRELEAAAEQCHQESAQWKQEAEETKRLLDTHIEKNRELEAAAEQCHQESAQWKQEAEQAQKQLNGYKTQELKYKNTIQKQLNKIQELDQVANEVEWMRNQIAEKDLEKETVSARLATTHTQLVQALEQLDSFRRTLEGVVHSKSWRITAPLRRFMEIMHGQKPAQAASGALPVFNVPVPESPAYMPLFGKRKKQLQDPADMLPESLYQNRPDVDTFVEKLLGHDIVSFDIFDTLILRTFDVPTDVFRLVGHRIGEESFAKLRIQAEQEARQHHQDKNGEVNIYEIYKELSKYLTIDADAVIRQELEAEKDCCFANPFMKAVYDELLRRKQKVIIVSDMYLPKDLLAELLHSCGYDGYDNLYVSCDYHAGKWNKKLYDIVERDNPESRTYIHVGDNQTSDVEHAKQNGWDAVFYPACRALGGELRAKGMDRLSVSAYNGIVNAHLHADSTVYTPEYEHGFRYAGYLVCGFCEWLNKYVEEHKIDRILFLARDADVIYKVYNQFYRKVDNRYMVVSRLATWIMAFETDTEAFIQNFFQSRANLGTQTIRTALEETDMAVLIPLLEEAGLSEDSLLTQANYQELRSFIQNNKAVVVEHYAPSKKAGQDYFREMIGDAKRVCAVDIGWSGQIMITMRKIIRDLFDGEVTLQGAYMALTDNAATSGFAESDIITPWLFHGCMNRDIAINTATVEGDMEAKFMEATFTSDQPTLLKYLSDAAGNTKFVYGIPSAESELVYQIQRGVLDFVNCWQRKTKILYPYLQIMPADAKRIFDYANKNPRYCYAILKDIREWEFPLPNFKGEGSLTTLGAMLKKKRMV